MKLGSSSPPDGHRPPVISGVQRPEELQHVTRQGAARDPHFGVAPIHDDVRPQMAAQRTERLPERGSSPRLRRFRPEHPQQLVPPQELIRPAEGEVDEQAEALRLAHQPRQLLFTASEAGGAEELEIQRAIGARVRVVHGHITVSSQGVCTLVANDGGWGQTWGQNGAPDGVAPQSPSQERTRSVRVR
jgi:hypothetical protein